MNLRTARDADVLDYARAQKSDALIDVDALSTALGWLRAASCDGSRFTCSAWPEGC